MFFGTFSTAIHRCVDGQSECARRGRLRSEPSEGTVDSDPVVDRKGPPDEPEKFRGTSDQKADALTKPMARAAVTSILSSQGACPLAQLK